MTGMFEQAVNRLEAVTQRLEATEARLSGRTGQVVDYEAPQSVAHQQSNPQQSSQQATLKGQPSQRSSITPSAATVGAGSSAAYQQRVLSKLAEVMSAAAPLGQDVGQPTAITKAAFEAQSNIVAAMAACSRPNAEGLQALVQPIGSHIGAAAVLADDRRVKAPQHCKVVAEALTGLSWPVYSGPSCGMNVPPQHVADAWTSAEFWANKLLMQHRNSASGKGHVDWVKAMKALMSALSEYLREFHALGPSWNQQGVPLESFRPSDTSAPSAPLDTPQQQGSAKPPPPPPPLPAGGPGSLLDRESPSSTPPAAKDVGRASLLASLNKGDSATSGLRKVTDSMKTKNRADRSGAVPAVVAHGTDSTQPPRGRQSLFGGARKAARFELEGGRKWVIEHQVGNRELRVEITDPKQTIYIFGCSGCVIQVIGKMNAITMDACEKTGVVFESAVASFEAVNSRSVQVQCTGIVPTVAIDKVDGCQVFLSASSLDTAILTAKSSEVNIVTPGATLEDDPQETPIPEQFISSYVDGRWVTSAVSHSGG